MSRPKTYTCLRCGATFTPQLNKPPKTKWRKQRTPKRRSRPESCGECKSKYWDKPRVRALKASKHALENQPREALFSQLQEKLYGAKKI